MSFVYPIYTELVIIFYFAIQTAYLYPQNRKHTYRYATTQLLFLLVSILLNHLAQKEYINWTYYKGFDVVKLPPIWMLVVAANIITEVIYRYDLRRYIFQTNWGSVAKNSYILSSINKMIVNFFIFGVLCITFWTYTIDIYGRKFDNEFRCFRLTLEQDLINYFINNGTVPDELTDFTTIIADPLSDTPLIYEVDAQPGAEDSVYGKTIKIKTASQRLIYQVSGFRLEVRGEAILNQNRKLYSANCGD